MSKMTKYIPVHLYTNLIYRLISNTFNVALFKSVSMYFDCKQYAIFIYPIGINGMH